VVLAVVAARLVVAVLVAAVADHLAVAARPAVEVLVVVEEVAEEVEVVAG
jgi:hypothetical protein